MTSILNPIAKPIAWVLAAFYSIIPNFGVAIIGLSLVWMILIAPLTLKSTRSMLAMQALQPEIKRLQEKHRGDKQAFAQAQMDLFRERKVSPLSSCLPSLLPLPVFIALFRVIDGLSHTVTTTVNGVKVITASPKYLNQHTAMYHAIKSAHGKISAFGLNLADNAFSHHSSVLSAIPFFILLLIMIGTSYLQTAMMMNRNPAAQQNPQMKMMKYLPLVFGVICARFPAGVVLYYAVSNICRISQQFAMYRWDPKVRALVTDEVRDVEARTRDIDRAQGVTPDYGDDDGPAVKPRNSFRELLAQTRTPPPPEDDATEPSGKATPPKSKPTNDRPGSVKANRNRNDSTTRPTRQGGGGSVKRAGSGTNGSNGNAAPRKPTGSTNGSGNGTTRGGGKPVAKDPKAGGAKTNGSPSGLNGNGKSNGVPRGGATGSGAGGRSGTGSASGGTSSPRNRRRRGR